jgi:hypothetical protein
MSFESSAPHNDHYSIEFPPPSHIEEEEEQEKKTLRQIVDNFIQKGNKKQYIEYVSFSFSITSFIIYVVSTYFDKDAFYYYNYVDILFCVFFNLESLLYLYLAQHRLLYLIKMDTIIDIYTSCMPYIAFVNNSIVSKMVETSRTFRIIRVTRFLNKNIKTNENEVAKQVAIMILSTTTLILIFTLIYRIVEIDTIKYYLTKPELDYLGLNSQTAFHDLLYFIVVTISTVGYGDIYPLTEAGRFVIILLIIIAIYLIPKQTNDLIKLINLSSVYSRASYKSNLEVPHIVISGQVRENALKNFCYELFHPDHGTQDKNAIIVQNDLPSQDMRVFLHAGAFEVFLKYLQGNPLLEKDLLRCDMINAKACVIMTDKYTADPHGVDHKNILLSLSIKKYFLYRNKDCQLLIQLIKPENKIHYLSGLQSFSNKPCNLDQVIIIEEIKMNLLSKSCLIPGIIAMVSNLVISAGSQSEDEMESSWLAEYTEGRGHEIYRTLLNSSLKNKTFSKLSAEIYIKYEAIVFALEIEVEGKTIIRLNPGNFYIERLVNERDDVKIYIYIICSDKSVADTIESDGIIEANDNDEEVVVEKPKIKTRFDDYMKLNIEDTNQIDENVDPGNEVAEEEDDYFIIKNDVKNNVDAKKDSIRNSDKITKHIVVCGTHPSLYYFILPLRAKYLGLENLKHVVILAQDIPKDLWDSISRFDDITLINGSPLNTEDLYRANIEYADKAVILDCENLKHSNHDNEMVDSETVFVYKAIKKCNQNIQIMTELVYDTNIEFLLPKAELSNLLKSDSRIEYETTSLFSAGEVYISSIIDTLTCQAFYNPHIVTILHQLLTGGKNNSNFTMRGICENVGLQSSNLWQMPIPERFISKTFVELFTQLAEEENLITLGLYRLPGANDNDHPYVYTNPKPDTRLTHRDRIFVLAINNINKYINTNDEKKTTTLPNDVKEDRVAKNFLNLMEDNTRSNKTTPFRYLEDTISEIERYVNHLDDLYKHIKDSLSESIITAVKQEISGLLN